MQNQKITPFLWFDGKAEKAVTYYASVFKNSKVTSINYWGEGTPFPKDQVRGATVDLDGIKFHAFDAGPQFKFTEAISFFVSCDNQEEVDYFWDKLSAGGEKGQCGWVKDQFGVSWQIVPKVLEKLMSDNEHGNTKYVMMALMQMTKLDIAALQKAYDQK